MTEKKPGTSLCGWCLGPPGARRPHKFGVQIAGCPCGCHRKARRIECSVKIKKFMEGGGYGTGDDAA